MKNIDLVNLVLSLEKSRQLTSQALPIGHSFIPFDILLAVIKGYLVGQELTVKTLFTGLQYSDMGIRYHFRYLIKNGWIELHNGDVDTRVRHVKPTEKLVGQFTFLSKQLQDTFEVSLK